MDSRILILLPLLLKLGLAATSGSANLPIEHGVVDTLRTVATDTIHRRIEPALADSTSAWSIPARDGSVGGALVEAFRGGEPFVPWIRVYEFDGMYESWSPWPSLPLAERSQRLAWTGPSLAGVSDAGPLMAASVAKKTEIGFGGEGVRRALAAPSPTDTPSTHLQFFRGSLASYRFGLGFSRALSGPWGLALAMGARSAQSRSWAYRDQIQDMFQGSFGRSRQDLPSSGHSPGQDDVQWESVLSRATPHLLLELGWTWVDLRRGIPNPLNTWNDSGLAPLAGRESRSGLFGRILREAGDWKGSLSGRWVGENWGRASWPRIDSGLPISVVGSTDHQELEGDLSWGGPDFRLGSVGRIALRTGTAGSVAGTFQEDQERWGVYVSTRSAAFESRMDVGINRLNDPQGRSLGGLDGSVSLDRSGPSWRSRNRIAREIRLPDWELTILPDPLLQSLPSRNLSTETRWFAESRHQWVAGPHFSIDGSFAAMSIERSIQPTTIPGATTSSVLDRSAMILANATASVVGWSSQWGARSDWGGWWVGSQWAVGQTMAPGEGPGGRRDLRYPVLHSRTTAGWQGAMLAGRATAASSMSLRTWSASTQSTGGIAATTATVRLPPGGQLDWENRFQIKTFGIFWRLENLLDDRQVPAVGWTPPGIRSGWGITWNFGG